MKSLAFVSLLLILIISKCFSQNLVANAGFEHKNVCVEYHVTCAPEAWFRIPSADISMVGNGGRSGAFYQTVVAENLKFPVTHRSFVYTKILCPLIKDSAYNMSLWINYPKNNFEHLDIWFNSMEPTRTKKTLKDITPQIIFKAENIVEHDDRGWVKVVYHYKANGDEGFLMIGNFSSQGLSSSVSNNSKGDVIYLIDDVELRPVESFAPCDEIEATRQQLYDLNYRHTAKKYIDDLPLQKLLIRKQPIPLDTSEKKETTLMIVDTPPPAKAANDTLVLPDILFRFNSSVINPAFASLLDSAAEQIKKVKYKGIEIIGHTDNAGSNQYNLNLSLHRAAAVKEYFIKRKGFHADIIQISAKGEEQPIEENSTAEGRQSNRRVEVILVK